MPSLAIAMNKSACLMLARKRWPSLLAITCLSLLLLLYWWDQISPNDDLIVANLLKHRWHRSESSRCYAVLKHGKFISWQSGDASGELYLSYSGNLFASPRETERDESEKISCTEVLGPSFVEEIE